MLRPVQLKVLQWSDDKGVVGRVAENAVQERDETVGEHRVLPGEEEQL